MPQCFTSRTTPMVGWQFLCGGNEHGDGQSDRALLVCLECLVADDLTLNELSDLCENWTAERDHLGDDWRTHDNSEDFIVEAVARHGWAVELVDAGEDESEPAFAYTVGLQKTLALLTFEWVREDQRAA